MRPVQDYIENFPPEVQGILNQVKNIILQTAKDAGEGFAYQMPSYKTHGKPLIYFAAFKNHIGFYATPIGHQAFQLAAYKQGKGSVQFPLNKTIPHELIREIVAFGVTENHANKT